MPTGTKRNTKIIDGAQWNQCTKCEEWFPATNEYFVFRTDQQQLHAKCRPCLNKANQLKIKKREEHYKKYHQEYAKLPKQRENRRLWAVKNKEEIKQYQKEWRQNNKDKIDLYHEENADRIKESKQEHYQKNKIKYRQSTKEFMLTKAKFSFFVDRLTVDEAAKPDNEGYLLVKCTYCGRYFIPTYGEVYNRVGVLSGKKNRYGEARLYCSNNCKVACPVFGQQFFYKGERNYANREVDPALRQMVLELDNYECQRCGKSIDEIILHVHHIQPYRRNLMLANDIDNTITFCVDCHLSWMHSNSGYGCIETKCKE